ncbi:nicotinamide/nicotinic acid mononucleotide adenylyltransferase isoform X1 [Histomonas meleagridis]|uniref:nicotinamide/nicotinic acid mononucleotide adenylyltransferase isoform X1 n=1 Tax=Histomonas meleagridis TaxID=135588 RepID=UPI003559BDC4|nr:nicotinamide/nicotinic acid mononucleotide adenylyltransferase isoform X1 [Histomonas meleagridis]KAH0802180.1 nicotinamide/nicotinic acid mononucleotide adenylyltransferase isoform X1 [Histomonas meleagridis]
MEPETQDAIITFVGCFNPPTNGHLHAIAAGYDYLKSIGYNMKKAIIVPAHGGYSKSSLKTTEDRQRLEMCRLMAEKTDFIEVDSVEIDKDHWSRTIDTLEYLKAKYPNTRIFLLCGIDTVEAFPKTWRKPDVIRIIEEFGVVVLPRKEKIENIEDHCDYFKGRMKYVHVIENNPMDQVSSTIVRNLISQGKHATGLISPEVEEYILKNNLFVNPE